MEYRIDPYDNFPNPDVELEVIYKNLENDLIVDTVQIPWEKRFKYSYTTTEDSLSNFDSHLIVQYEGDKPVFLKATISTDTEVDEI